MPLHTRHADTTAVVDFTVYTPEQARCAALRKRIAAAGIILAVVFVPSPTGWLMWHDSAGASPSSPAPETTHMVSRVEPVAYRAGAW